MSDPGEWVAVVNPKGKKWYYNTTTRVSTFQLPEGLEEEPPVMDLPAVQEPPATPTCLQCKKPGHFTKDCPQLYIRPIPPTPPRSKARPAGDVRRARSATPPYHGPPLFPPQLPFHYPIPGPYPPYYPSLPGSFMPGDFGLPYPGPPHLPPGMYPPPPPPPPVPTKGPPRPAPMRSPDPSSGGALRRPSIPVGPTAAELKKSLQHASARVEVLRQVTSQRDGTVQALQRELPEVRRTLGEAQQAAEGARERRDAAYVEMGALLQQQEASRRALSAELFSGIPEDVARTIIPHALWGLWLPPAAPSPEAPADDPAPSPPHAPPYGPPAPPPFPGPYPASPYGYPFGY